MLRTQLGLRVEAAAAADVNFGQQLLAITGELDRRGGRDFIYNSVGNVSGPNMQAIGTDNVVIGDYVDVPNPYDHSDARHGSRSRSVSVCSWYSEGSLWSGIWL